MLSMIATAAITHIMCKHAKLKALVTGIAFQPIKGTEAIFNSINDSENCTSKAQWYTITAFALMIIGLIFFILATTRKCRIFRGHLFFNTGMVMLFFSDADQYVPVKLCKTVGNIHLFKILRHFVKEIVVGCGTNRLERSPYDLHGNMIHLPTSVIIPLTDMFRLRCIMRKRSFLLHIMLKQGTSWYTLDSKGYLHPPPCLDNSKI